MLGPITDSILTRLVFALANFASTEILTYEREEPNSWNLIWCIIFYIAARVSYLNIVEEWTPIKQTHALSKDIFTTFMDANWLVVMFVLVQWGVDMFEAWWKVQENVLLSVIVTELPLMFMQLLIVVVAATDFGFISIGSTSTVVVKDVLSQLNFSFGFFIADRVVELIKVQPNEWELLWMGLGFVAWHSTVSRLLEAWNTEEDTHKECAKFIFIQNFGVLNTSFVLVLTGMFTQIVNEWWVETGSFIAGGCMVTSIVFFGIYIAVRASSIRHYRQVDAEVAAQTGNLSPKEIKEIRSKFFEVGGVPDYMINRGLFMMAMFVATKLATAIETRKTLWMVFWLLTAFIVCQSMFGTVIELWFDIIKTERKHIVSVIDANSSPGSSGFSVELRTKARAMLKNNRGTEVLYMTVKKTINTWFTTAIIFIVRWMTEIFGEWWHQDDNWIESLCMVECVTLFIILVVKASMYYDGTYDKVLNDSSDKRAFTYGVGVEW